MKFLVSILILLISLSVFGNSNNRIVAVVNENIITSQSIKDKLDASISHKEKLRVVNEAIELSLQLELIDKYNLYPTDFEINEALFYISAQNNISMQDLKQNENFNLISIDVKKKLSLFNLKNFLTKDLDLKTSNTELEKYCNYNTNRIDKQIKIAEIIIKIPDGSDLNMEQPDIRIKDFLSKLKNHLSKGADFFDLAKLHSQHPSYYNGGISDWKSLDTPLLKSLENLKENQVSDIYKRNDGWAIAIKVDERKLDIALEECSKEIKKKKAQEYFETYMQDFKIKSSIKIYENNL